LHGDLGLSLHFQRPVGELILSALPVSLFLAAYVICISVPVSIALAVLTARNEGRNVDLVIRFFAVCGITIPVFWLAIILLRVFSVDLGWFPVAGYGETFAGHLHH